MKINKAAASLGLKSVSYMTDGRILEISTFIFIKAAQKSAGKLKGKRMDSITNGTMNPTVRVLVQNVPIATLKPLCRSLLYEQFEPNREAGAAEQVRGHPAHQGVATAH